MAPVLGHLEGHHDEVSDAHADLLQAARAQVGLARLERVDERNLEVVLVRHPISAHNTSTRHTTTAATISA